MNGRVLLWLGLAVIVFSAPATPAIAQEPPRPPLQLIATGDSVRVLLTESPPVFGGFVVYRAQVGSTLTRVVDEPIRQIRDPNHASAVLGAAIDRVHDALETTDPVAVLRRLRNDPFAADILSMLFPQVAQILGRSFVDTSLTRDATYRYEVVYTDATGQETDRRVSGRVRIADVIPTAPSLARAEAANLGARVSWAYPAYRGGSTDFVVGFHVYRQQDPVGRQRRLTDSPVLRNELAPLAYLDRDAAAGGTYRYQIRALDVAGRESAPTDPVTVTVVDRQPPAVPRDVQATPGDGRVDLRWRASPEPDAAGYHVERATGLDQPYDRLTAAPVAVDQHTYADRTVVGGRPYFYRVIAVDETGNTSEPSNAISALPIDRTPPAAPSDVRATVVERRLHLSWRSSPSPDVKGYYIYRGDADDRLVRLVEQPIADTVFTDLGFNGAGLAPGHEYVFRISAVDFSYNESDAVEGRASVPDDEAPQPPTGLAIRNRHGRVVEIAWSASPALDVAVYELMRTELGQEPRLVARVPPTDRRSLRDTTVQRGITYRYALTAVDTAGNRSQPVIDSIAFRDRVPPPAPRHITARVGPDGIDVSWERVIDRELAAYRVYRSALPNGVYERVAEVPPDTLRYVDPSGQSNHFYVIRAVDRSGNESASSPFASGRR